MGEITEFIIAAFPGLKYTWLIWPAIFICVFILFVLVWLLFRSVRLWYWKVNVQINTLSDVNRKLQSLEENLKTAREPAAAEEEPQAIAAPESETEIADSDEDETEVPEPAGAINSMGKSGKIYTEEELEILIRD